VLLTVAIGASARGRTVSYLRTLGLGRAQMRRLIMVQLGPGIVCAAVTGWVLRLLLPRIVGPAMDLRAHTGGFPASNLALDPRWTALLAGVLAASAGLALTVDAAMNTRRHLGGALRMGDQR
jgi:putative ABC transport system permease protein